MVDLSIFQKRDNISIFTNACRSINIPDVLLISYSYFEKKNKTLLLSGLFTFIVWILNLFLFSSLLTRSGIPEPSRRVSVDNLFNEAKEHGVENCIEMLCAALLSSSLPANQLSESISATNSECVPAAASNDGGSAGINNSDNDSAVSCSADITNNGSESADINNNDSEPVAVSSAATTSVESMAAEAATKVPADPAAEDPLPTAAEPVEHDACRESTAAEPDAVVPTGPTATDIAAIHPMPSVPAAIHPMPSEPMHIQPAATVPVEVEPVTSEPVHINPTPSDPMPIKPITSEPASNAWPIAAVHSAPTAAATALSPRLTHSPTPDPPDPPDLPASARTSQPPPRLSLTQVRRQQWMSQHGVQQITPDVDPTFRSRDIESAATAFLVQKVPSANKTAPLLQEAPHAPTLVAAATEEEVSFLTEEAPCESPTEMATEEVVEEHPRAPISPLAPAKRRNLVVNYPSIDTQHVQSRVGALRS